MGFKLNRTGRVIEATVFERMNATLYITAELATSSARSRAGYLDRYRLCVMAKQALRLVLPMECTLFDDVYKSGQKKRYKKQHGLKSSPTQLPEINRVG